MTMEIRHSPPPQQDISDRDKFVPNPHRATRIVLSALAFSLVCCSAANTQTLTLKDGRKLEGKYAEIGSIAENPLSPKSQAGEVPVTPLLVVDDGLRRTFIHSFQ